MISPFPPFLAVQDSSICDLVPRLEISRDRRDRRSCKFFSSCVIFSRKQRVSLQNLRRNMKFTHMFGKLTHTFSKTFDIYIFHFQQKKD